MAEYETEGAGVLLAHGFLLLDGSGSMEEPELRTGLKKHRAVAKMAQDLINELHDDDAITNTLLTIICYDGRWVDDVRLRDYDIKSATHYKPDYADSPERDSVLDLWDPLRGHGGTTPIGRAFALARRLAEDWVNTAPAGLVHRAAIYLLSDGMNYPDTEPNGMGERQEIEKFYHDQEAKRAQGGYKGRIRVATVGYYQSPPGKNPEEDKGRELLDALAFPSTLYFETSNAKEIARFIRQTVTE